MCQKCSIGPIIFHLILLLVPVWVKPLCSLLRYWAPQYNLHRNQNAAKVAAACGVFELLQMEKGGIRSIKKKISSYVMEKPYRRLAVLLLPHIEKMLYSLRCCCWVTFLPKGVFIDPVASSLPSSSSPKRKEGQQIPLLVQQQDSVFPWGRPKCLLEDVWLHVSLETHFLMSFKLCVKL